MKKHRVIALLLCIATVLCIAVFAAGGSADESLVTLSYFKEFFTDVFFKRAEDAGKTLEDNANIQIDAALKSILDNSVTKLDSALMAAVENRVIEKLTSQPEVIVYSKTEQVDLYIGDRIVGKPGAGVILQSGTAKICGPSGSEVINVTTGSTRAPGFVIKDGVYYMIVEEDESGIEITSQTATALIKDGAYILRGYEEQYTKYAEMLNTLGLFLGSNKGYELERAPTRQEALIMLIRLLGEEKDAIAFDEKNMTFTDVTGWLEGRRYIAYGSYKKYTNGRSPAIFDQYGIADANMYVTFVLRALGYSDTGANPDFVWNTSSLSLAVEIGLLTPEQCADMVQYGLRRDHVVLISLNALFKSIKGGGNTLINTLIDKGVVNYEQVGIVIGQLFFE